MDLMRAELQVVSQFHGLNGAVEEVASVLHIRADAQLLVAIRFVQPVLSLNVVSLFLAIVEERGGETDGSLAKTTRCPKRSEKRLELVFLLSVEIDLEAFYILQRAELGLAIGRLEVVVVAIDIDYRVESPILRGSPTEVGLIVEEIRLVFALRFERAEHILIRLITQAVAERELLLSVAHIDVCAKQTGCNGSLEAFGMRISDVEHRGHSVAILRLETACREVDLLHHIAIDDGKSLLLPTADEHRPVNLHTIDVDAVLVERTAAHIILARKLVMGADASLRGNKFLYRIAARGRHSLEVFRVEFLHRPHLPSRLSNSHFGHFLAALSHHNVESEVAFRLLQDTLASLVANHAVNHHHTIGSMEGEVVLSVQRSRRAKRLTFYAYLTQRHRVLALVDNPSLQVNLRSIRLLFVLSRHIHNAPKERQKKQYETFHLI